MADVEAAKLRCLIHFCLAGAIRYDLSSYLLLREAVYIGHITDGSRERVAEWLRRLTRKPKVRTAVGSNLALAVWSLSVTLARVDQSHVREIW